MTVLLPLHKFTWPRIYGKTVLNEMYAVVWYSYNILGTLDSWFSEAQTQAGFPNYEKCESLCTMHQSNLMINWRNYVLSNSNEYQTAFYTRIRSYVQHISFLGTGSVRLHHSVLLLTLHGKTQKECPLMPFCLEDAGLWEYHWFMKPTVGIMGCLLELLWDLNLLQQLNTRYRQQNSVSIQYDTEPVSFTLHSKTYIPKIWLLFTPCSSKCPLCSSFPTKIQYLILLLLSETCAAHFNLLGSIDVIQQVGCINQKFPSHYYLPFSTHFFSPVFIYFS